MLPEPVVRAFDAGAFALPARSPLGTSGTQLAQEVWRIPVVMVGFRDLPLGYTPADFETALFDSGGAMPTGSVHEYWRWASGGRLRILGRVVGVVQLPQDLAYYGFNYWGLRLSATPNNIFGAIRNALDACEAGVDWSEFDLDRDGYVDMMWLVHAGIGGEAMRDYNSLWSITSRLSGGWAYGEAYRTSDPVPGSSTQFMRIDRFSTLPELSSLIPGRRAEIGVFAHEFGHALGLPDLYDTSALGGAANVGPGFWSVMGTGGSGANGVTPETPSHPGAWPLKMLGWQEVVRPTEDTTIVLGPLGEGAAAVEVSFEGEPWREHLLVENRQRLGFDRFVTSEGLIVYHLDEAVLEAGYASNRVNSGLTPGLRVVEADGRYDLVAGRNRGEASDPFPGALGRTDLDESTEPSTDTFLGAPSGLALHDIAPEGDGMRVTLRVRAPGWGPALDITEAGFAPFETVSPARTAALLPGGDLAIALSEARAGLPQVHVRTRRAGAWQPSERVSDPAVPAADPTLVALPGGDLAVAWSETRGGASRIVYRARVGGAWSAARTLAELPGDSFRPSLGADAHGVVHATWLQYDGIRAQVMFQRFAYTSPFGPVRTLTDTTQTPEDPSVAVASDGRSYVLWRDRGSRPQMLWFSRYHPDSGLSPRQRLTPSPFHDQTGYAACVDVAHRLNAVWFETGGGATSIHFQRRPLDLTPWMPDSTIEVRAEVLQNAALECDPQGALHLAYESYSGGEQSLRYKRWRPGLGWDARSTALTRPSDGYASRPRPLPSSPGRLTVIHTGYPQGAVRLLVRERDLEAAPVLAAPAAPTVSRPVLRAGPSPLRRGEDLVLRAPLAGPGRVVELLDVAGRRVAEVVLTPGGNGLRGVIDRARLASLPAGLYLARLRDAPGPAARIVVLP
jgi:immune inhibitor A